MPKMTDDQKEQLLDALRKLAGSNKTALARLHDDAFRLHAAAMHGREKQRLRAAEVDAAKGKRKLDGLAGKARKLADELSDLPPNLRRAFRDPHELAELAEQISEEIKAAGKNFVPSRRSGTRHWTARQVEHWAAQVYRVYRQKRKASISNNPYKDEKGAGGEYLTFLSRVFKILDIADSPLAAVKSRTARDAEKMSPK